MWHVPSSVLGSGHTASEKLMENLWPLWFTLLSPPSPSGTRRQVPHATMSPAQVFSPPYFILSSSFKCLNQNSCQLPALPSQMTYFSFSTGKTTYHLSCHTGSKLWITFHYTISFIPYFEYTPNTSCCFSPWKCLFHLSLFPQSLSTILISAPVPSFLDLWKEPQDWVLISFILCFRIHSTVSLLKA